MGGSWYYSYSIEETCPNCGRKFHGGVSASMWGHDATVCSSSCGKRLGQRIKNGMVDGSKYQYRDFVSYDDNGDRIALLRRRIKLLEHRLKEVSKGIL